MRHLLPIQLRRRMDPRPPSFAHSSSRAISIGYFFHFQNEAKGKNFLVIRVQLFHINGFALNLALNLGQLGNHLLMRSKSQMTPHGSVGIFICSSS